MLENAKSFECMTFFLLNLALRTEQVKLKTERKTDEKEITTKM